MEQRLGASPTPDLPLVDALQQIRDFVRDPRNEALRRLASSQRRQARIEKFTEFYVRLRQAADDVDLCKGHNSACVKTRIKQATLIGIQDEGTKQRLPELKSDAALELVITVRRSREAVESPTREFRATQPATRTMSAHWQKWR